MKYVLQIRYKIYSKRPLLQKQDYVEIIVTQTKGNRQHDNLLVAGSDLDPVLVKNPRSTASVAIICEHAGQNIPIGLNNLGLSQAERNLHIAYDIGAGKVATLLSEKLQCALILQRYSRLVIDCNRAPGSAQSIPSVSDSVVIPQNVHISPTDRRARESAIFDPYAKECQARISQNHIRFAFSIHSFTPKLGDTDRPWDIGFLHRHSHSQGDQLVRLAKHLWPNLTIGKNQPYMIEDATDWFIPVCAEPRALPHSLIEIRNDHLLNDRGCHDWAERLFILLSTFMEDHNDPDP